MKGGDLEIEIRGGGEPLHTPVYVQGENYHYLQDRGEERKREDA